MSEPAALDDCTRLDPRAFYNLRMHLIVACQFALNRDRVRPGLHARLEYRPTPAPDLILPGDEPAPVSPARRYTDADRVFVKRDADDRTVGLIEIASPGDREDADAAAHFVTRTVRELEGGADLLLIDLLPPGPGAPAGLIAAVCRQLEVSYDPADGGPEILSLTGGPARTIRTWRLANGEPLPEVPLPCGGDPSTLFGLGTAYSQALVALGIFWREVLIGVRNTPGSG